MDKEYYKHLLEKNNSQEIDAENIWDTRAESFNKAQQNDKTGFAKNVTKLLEEKDILKGKDVLDIGGGSGRYALEFSQFAKSITVTDISKNRNIDTDVPILYWQEAKLRFESFARIDKYLLLDDTDFSFKIGDLHQDDLNLIETRFIEYVLNHK